MLRSSLLEGLNGLAKESHKARCNRRVSDNSFTEATLELIQRRAKFICMSATTVRSPWTVSIIIVELNATNGIGLDHGQT